MRIDLVWMMRRGLAREGDYRQGTLSWTCNGSPSGSIGYRASMDAPGSERLTLDYSRGSGEDTERVNQTIRLIFTEPNYGGKRWWMICPYRHIRVGKLYLPPGGDRFACRRAWRLGYQSQRDAARDKPFERLFRLQKKLGCELGWGNVPTRPKGMWHRTYERHMETFWELDEQCSLEMAGMLTRFKGEPGEGWSNL
ncbi:hypothetical protein KYN89_12805 [Alteriqipengyuania sp. NZ-12B]|uniref:Uncharacterized protein n=1 Tax=Alteriqipengyuania abyssalis TaxID=2860200 RepID=A0ABS7PFT1_9SPHN|nr:hypothetical protein [Alteriqipengyuania abyssalis]MBY8337923.1 hypothetical protein [Alteriqipengyuania abyssalis]